MNAVIDLCDDSPSPHKRPPLRRRSIRLNPITNNESDNENDLLSKLKASRLKRKRPILERLAHWGDTSEFLDPLSDTPPAKATRSSRSTSRKTSKDDTTLGGRLRKWKAKALTTKAKDKASSRSSNKSDNVNMDGMVGGNMLLGVASLGKMRGKDIISRPLMKKPKKKSTNQSDYDSDIQVVEKPVERPMVRPKKAATKGSNDDEVIFEGAIGINALENYPHEREHCVVETFTQGNHSSHCDNCYCLVCDVPVKDCKNWETRPHGHCHATRKDPKWLGMREALKKK